MNLNVNDFEKIINESSSFEEYAKKSKYAKRSESNSNSKNFLQRFLNYRMSIKTSLYTIR